MKSIESIVRGLKVSKGVLASLKRERAEWRRRDRAFRAQMRAIGEDILAVTGAEPIKRESTPAPARRTPRR